MRNLITTGGEIGKRNSIVLTQATRWHRDLEDYMRAIDAAERIDYPSRVRLQDLYKTALDDAHLFSVLNKRIDATMELELEFVRNDKPDKKVKELIDSPWFYDFLRNLLESVWLGPALFQFYPDKENWLTCDLIPRKHVDPVRRQILYRQTDIQGQSWDDFQDLLFVGKPREIGYLAKALPYVLFKNGTMGDWANFCEIFGMPIREYTYDSADPEGFSRILHDAKEQGGSGVYVHDTSSTLKLIASSGAGSGDLYEGLINRCNSELSKLVLSNTLTTEASEKGTQALGTVHQKAEKTVTKADQRFILNVLNYQLSDLLSGFGINVKGGQFKFVEPDDIPLVQRIQIDQQVAAQGVPIAHDYWYSRYGIPKPDDYDELLAAKEKKAKQQTDPQPDPDPDPDPNTEPNPANPDGGKGKGEKKKDKNKEDKKASGLLNTLRNFFAQAPKSGAIGW